MRLRRSNRARKARTWTRYKHARFTRRYRNARSSALSVPFTADYQRLEVPGRLLAKSKVRGR